MRFYNPITNWHRLKPHLANPELQHILHRDFNRFTMGCWNKPFTAGMRPCDFERYELPGRIVHRSQLRHNHPYTDYVKSFSCHWLVNFNLKWVSLTEPNRAWRIITEPGHSSVFDGKYTIFDLQCFAMGIKCEEVYRVCRKELPVGEEINPPVASLE